MWGMIINYDSSCFGLYILTDLCAFLELIPIIPDTNTFLVHLSVQMFL